MNAQTLHAKPTFKQFHLFADCKAALARYAYCRTHPNPIAVSLLALASAKNLKRQCAQLRAYIRELDQSPNAISLPKAIKFQQELQELLHGFYPLRKPKKAITVATLPHILDEVPGHNWHFRHFHPKFRFLKGAVLVKGVEQEGLFLCR